PCTVDFVACRRAYVTLSISSELSPVGVHALLTTEHHRAQEGATAQIDCIVKYDSGGELPGVDITVTQTATGVTRSAVSDADGAYTLTNLPISPYRLEATLQGFRSYLHTEIVLQVNAKQNINDEMTIRDHSEQITVQ